MATLPAAAHLTENHRLAQARIGVATQAQALAAWTLIDPRNLDATLAGWLSIALPLVAAQHAISARLAAGYYEQFRAITAPHAPPLPVAPVETLDTAQATTALTVTGPVSLKTDMSRGLLLDEATDRARIGAARSAMRLALNGGRQTLVHASAIDPEAHGWARAVSGQPCQFCADLAGIEFRDEEAASFQAHDGCSCSAEPLIGAGASPPPR